MSKVSIIVTTWAEASKPYLDACVASIQSLNYPKEQLDVILVGRNGYMPEYAGVRTVAPPEDLFSPERAMNFAASLAAPDSKHFLFCNDDVVFSQNSLSNLIEIAGDQDMLLMPISPCDNYWKYHLHFPIQSNGDTLMLTDRFYKMDQLEEHLPALMRAESVYPQGAIVTDMLCTFAVLIPRTTWAKVGEWDEGFSLGQCDYDYCLRAKALSIPRLIALNSVVWQFGGATSTSGNSDKRRSRNARYYRAKWGVWPEGFDYQTLDDITNAELREFGFIGE